MRQNRDKTNSIEKALRVLSCFVPYNEELGTVEIAKRLGFHKATVSRILLILAAQGYLRQDPETRKFSLGPAVIELGTAIHRSLSNNLTNIAKPHVDKLRNSLRETIVLEVVRGKNAIIAYVAEGPGPIRIKGTIGDMRPAHAAAGAKAILAFSPPDMKARLLSTHLEPLTPNTITEPEILHRQLEEIRKQGFAIDREEVNVGINAVGVPVFDYQGKPVAGVVAAGLSQAINWGDESPLVSMLKDSASRISKELCFKGESPLG
ncbi:MAG: IclR family transcriptional regulator [Deltaproteobacteria bacterium]|nr:IclR family transcriptional regulator [Deltaproteobacteria bacterium]MBW2138660.1 IclR family transcriptional regulator [Deltaproteobacteria bacterium]